MPFDGMAFSEPPAVAGIAAVFLLPASDGCLGEPAAPPCRSRFASWLTPVRNRLVHAIGGAGA